MNIIKGNLKLPIITIIITLFCLFVTSAIATTATVLQLAAPKCNDVNLNTFHPTNYYIRDDLLTAHFNMNWSLTMPNQTEYFISIRLNNVAFEPLETDKDGDVSDDGDDEDDDNDYEVEIYIEPDRSFDEEDAHLWILQTPTVHTIAIDEQETAVPYDGGVYHYLPMVHIHNGITHNCRQHIDPLECHKDTQSRGRNIIITMKIDGLSRRLTQEEMKTSNTTLGKFDALHPLEFNVEFIFPTISPLTTQQQQQQQQQQQCVHSFELSAAPYPSYDTSNRFQIFFNEYNDDVAGVCGVDKYHPVNNVECQERFDWLITNPKGYDIARVVFQSHGRQGIFNNTLEGAQTATPPTLVRDSWFYTELNILEEIHPAAKPRLVQGKYQRDWYDELDDEWKSKIVHPFSIINTPLRVNVAYNWYKKTRQMHYLNITTELNTNLNDNDTDINPKYFYYTTNDTWESWFDRIDEVDNDILSKKYKTQTNNMGSYTLTFYDREGNLVYVFQRDVEYRKWFTSFFTDAVKDLLITIAFILLGVLLLILFIFCLCACCACRAIHRGTAYQRDRKNALKQVELNSQPYGEFLPTNATFTPQTQPPYVNQQTPAQHGYRQFDDQE